ncbi:metallophosphoesterase family protein [Streptococcus dentapri]|uniref:Nuclease SbcCD subunit D n=1 Tax=Streptococcus dentapri TaxID=573564 RepID=A0ABV8D177_9STRE
MKLLHTADWHIGRQLNNNGISLLADQNFMLNEIISIAKREAVDGVIIAGDLYDRGMPPVEAVKLFDETLTQLLFENQIPVYAITGNHDSAKRLQFGQEFFKRQHFHLVSRLDDAFQPVETDEAQIFLLPFIDPIDARIYYQDKDIRDIKQAIERIVTDMKPLFKPDKAHILVTHFAVAKGKDDDALREQMLSETTRTVGGLTTLTSDLFEDFDYVALGHIHTRFASPTEKIAYSGSPLIFNKDEAKRGDIKGGYLLEISAESFEKTFIPLPVYKDFLVLEAPYQTLISKDFYNQYPRHQVRFAFEILVEDRKELEGINIRAQLEEIYGEEIVDLRIRETNPREVSRKVKISQKGSDLSDDVLIANFFQEMTGGQNLSDYQKEVITELLSEIKEEN